LFFVDASAADSTVSIEKIKLGILGANYMILKLYSPLMCIADKKAKGKKGFDFLIN
jgi:hypothetical protein